MSFKIPELIKSGDDRVKLGAFNYLPKVDCRVVAEDNFQELIALLKDIKEVDILGFVNGQKGLLPHFIRRQIHQILLQVETEESMSKCCGRCDGVHDVCRCDE